MASVWIIDGYNFIRCSRRFSAWEAEAPEEGRDAALAWLGEFAGWSGEELWVVLDHYSSLERERRELSAHGLKVLLSRGSYTADEEILALVQEMGERAIVISSDREVQRGARSAGATILSSPEFERELAPILQRIHRESGEGDEDLTPLPPRGKSGPKVPREKKKAILKLRKYQ